jgi:hypothetical protein
MLTGVCVESRALCIYWISVAIADWGGYFTTGRARRRVERESEREREREREGESHGRCSSMPDVDVC